MSKPFHFAVACFILISTAVLRSSETRFNHIGKLQQIALGKGWMPLTTDIKIPLKGWSKVLSFADSKPSHAVTGDVEIWKGKAADGAATLFAVEQSAQEKDGKLVIDVRATAQAAVETEGIYFWIDLPSDAFAGGSYRAAAEKGILPLELPKEIHLCNVVTANLALKNAAGAELIADLQPAGSVLIQDGRKWSHHFSVLVQVGYGVFKQGDSLTKQISLSTSGEVESAPAKISVDAASPQYKITGIGGNYCFGIESPVTRYTLDNLNVAFARTEMTLIEWEPENDDADANHIKWDALVAHDKPNTRLHREFELMRELSEKKIPYIASIWKLPPWLYTKPPDEKNERNLIDDAKWPEVIECIISYLQYAKEKYKAEPAYFSFNESNYGVRVLFTGDEHRDLMKRLGPALQKAGLKTRMLLGDVGGPRDTIGFTTPTVNDPEAMKYVGAVSFHSWGGASAQQYNAWADLSEKLKLPLIVAEAGVDAAAWENGLFQSYDYGVREVAHYMELFQHARPQAILLWEYTADYSTMGMNKFDRKRLVITERFCFQKHWCDLTPPGSEALKVASDKSEIMAAMFRHGPDNKRNYTLHVANPKWGRQVTIEGIPSSVKMLNVVRTARGEMFKKLEPMNVSGGKLTLELPMMSLITLTTLEIPALKEP